MRPLRMKVQGFGPFREAVEIDFEDLDLFALVGSTGSGKSSIIDAITFALFGRLARLDAKKVAPVVNALSQEARVVLDFALGGDVYTAARVVRRTKTGASVKEIRLERGVEMIADGKGPVDEAIETLLGLNFDRFNRVVVLPQGQFAAFLHDGRSERQRLLRTMLQIGIYERMGKRAREIQSVSANTLEVLRPRVAGADGEELDLAQREALAKSLRATQKVVDEKLDRHTKADEKRDELLTEAEEFGMLALAVDDVEVPDAVTEIGERLERAGAQFKKATKADTDANAALLKANAAVEKGPDRAEVQGLLDRRDELDQVSLNVKELEKQVKAAIEASGEAADALAKQKAVIAGEEDRLASAEVALQTAVQAAKDGPNPSSIAEGRAAHNGASDAKAAVDKLGPDLAAAEANTARFEQDVLAARNKLDAAVDRRVQVERDAHVDVLADGLTAGDECPVCLRPITDLPEHDSSGELEAVRATEGKADQHLQAAQARLSKHEKALAELAGRMGDATTALADKMAVAADLPSVDALDRLDDEIASLATSSDNAMKERGLLAEKVQALRTSEDMQSALDRAERAATKATAKQAELESERKRQTELNEQLKEAPAPKQLAAMLAEAQRLADQRAETTEIAEGARHEREKAAEDLQAAQAEETELRAGLDEVRTLFANIEGVPAPGHESLLGDWKAFAKWAAKQRAPLEKHHAKVTSAAEKAAAAVDVAAQDLTDSVGDLAPLKSVPFDELHESLIKLVADADAKAEQARQSHERLAKDRAQITELEEDTQVYGMLGVLLKSDRFEQWILDEVIEALAERASVHLFELSSGQYSIEAESMVFQIRDHRNGDELRDARTLSGGETFLASLALALALADSIREMAPEGLPPIESLFLDEGFGTLDPETLDVVAAAIEELGASGRMVGVVTHIRDLAERMPVRFEVSKHAVSSDVERVEV